MRLSPLLLWVFSAGGPVWQPVVFGPDLLVTQGSRVMVVRPGGTLAATMSLDRPATAAAIPTDFGIVAADVFGSVYCFDAGGRRRWKYARETKATDYRVLVAGGPGVLLSDSRGTLIGLDVSGRLRFEVRATDYRVSTPAVSASQLVFATEDNEVYSVDARGNLQWRSALEGRFGRGLPVLAGGMVLISTPFNNRATGLYALDAASGKLLWRAPSRMQSYHSTVVADLNHDGRNEILYGDKNTRLYCVDEHGRPLWNTQLDGRGIFFAPAVADLDGQVRIFQVVRGAGMNGNSLYTLDASGRVLDAMPLPGGGASAPVLRRIEGGLALVVAGGNGEIQAFRLRARQASILGVREAAGKWGAAEAEAISGDKRPAVTGENALHVPEPEGASFAAVRVVDPDGAVHLDLGLGRAFRTVAPGPYGVEVRWCDAAGRTLAEERRAYLLDAGRSADRAELETFLAALPRSGALSEYFATEAQAEFNRTRQSSDAARARRAYELALLRYVGRTGASADVALEPIPNPWQNLNATALLGDPHRRTLAVRMLGNEYESAAVAVINLKPEPVTLRVSSNAPPGALELRDVPLVLPNRTGRPSEDPLPLLARDQTIRLAPGETRKLWLTFHSRDLAAGTYDWVLRAGGTLSFGRGAELPLSVTIHKLRLPDRFTYRHCNWLYLTSIHDPRMLQATIADAVSHGTNVFNLPQVTVQVNASGEPVGGDTAVDDRLIPMLPGAFFLIDGSVALRWPAGEKPDAATADRAYAAALHWFAAHMKALGLDYTDYALYLQDEPGLMGHDANFEHWVAMVRRVKAADPHVQVYANPTGGATPQDLAPVAHLVDVWCPNIEFLDQDPALAAIFRHARQYWHYEAPADQRNLDPLGFYRAKPWVAWRHGMTGGGYWVYSQTDYWRPDPSLPTEYGVVYPTERGPVTTRRWEASRDGSEDYEILRILRDRATRAHNDAGRRALALLDEAVAFVTRGQDEATDIARQLHSFAPDYGRWMDYRERLIAAAEALEP